MDLQLTQQALSLCLVARVTLRFVGDLLLSSSPKLFFAGVPWTHSIASHFLSLD